MGRGVTGLSGATGTVPSVARDELIGLSEVAEALGVSKMTAARYTRRDDFPKPKQELRRGRLWSRKQVEAWAKRTLPLPQGRPPE